MCKMCGGWKAKTEKIYHIELSASKLQILLTPNKGARHKIMKAMENYPLFSVDLYIRVLYSKCKQIKHIYVHCTPHNRHCPGAPF